MEMRVRCEHGKVYLKVKLIWLAEDMFACVSNLKKTITPKELLMGEEQLDEAYRE